VIRRMDRQACPHLPRGGRRTVVDTSRLVGFGSAVLALHKIQTALPNRMSSRDLDIGHEPTSIIVGTRFLSTGESLLSLVDVYLPN
jgi:hypothetical protein